MRRSRSLSIVALLLGVALGASALSALLPPEEVPSDATPSAAALSNALVFGEWIVTLLGAVVAVVLVGWRPRRAAHLLAAGLYTLAVGIAFVWYGLSAFGGGDAGLGPALFGAPLVLLSGIVASASGSVVVAQRHRQGRLGRALVVATVGATLTIGWLLLRGPGDWQGAVSATRLHGAPIVLAVGVISVALSLMGHIRPHSGCPGPGHARRIPRGVPLGCPRGASPSVGAASIDRRAPRGRDGTDGPRDELGLAGRLSVWRRDGACRGALRPRQGAAG